MKLCKTLEEALAYAKNSSIKHQELRCVVSNKYTKGYIVQNNTSVDAGEKIIVYYKNGKNVTPEYLGADR